MLGYKRPKPGKAEHLAFRVVGLDQPIAVEEPQSCGTYSRTSLATRL